MAKEFIRHLEYYGFPDQNAFSKEGWPSPADGRQDHAIHELFKRTHMLKDWNVKQEKDIKDLTKEYNSVAETVLEHESDINQINSNVNALSGEVEDIKEQIGTDVPSINERLDDLSGKVEDNHTEFIDYSATTAQFLKDYSEWVDLRYAHQEDTYKKDEVYTKDEVDAKISGGVEGYATEEWVKSQNYLTEGSGNTLYVRLDAFNPYSAATKTAIDDVVASASTLKNEIHILDENVDDYHAQVEDYIGQTQALNTRVGSAETRIGVAEDNINTINTILPSKANSATVETYVTTLNGRIDNLSAATDNKLSTKVDNDTYNGFTALTNQAISNLGDDKANKTETAALSGMVATEESARIAGDQNLQGQIDTLNNETIPSINDEIQDINDRIDNDVFGAISAETAARIQGDLDLIGNSGDTYTAITINGAKAEALRQATSAYTSATQYADSVGTNIRTVDLVNLRNDVNTAIGTKASSADLSGAVNDMRAEYRAADSNLEIEFTNQLEAEAATRFQDDQDLRRDIASNASAVSSATTRINAITAWNGSDPAQYVNTGNGVLDVLHREFHALIDTLTQKGILP